MITFTAIFKESSIKSKTGKIFNYPACEKTFEQDEVVDTCKSAANWAEIRAKYFPMHGFHN